MEAILDTHGNEKPAVAGELYHSRFRETNQPATAAKILDLVGGGRRCHLCWRPARDEAQRFAGEDLWRKQEADAVVVETAAPQGTR